MKFFVFLFAALYIWSTQGFAETRRNFELDISGPRVTRTVENDKRKIQSTGYTSEDETSENRVNYSPIISFRINTGEYAFGAAIDMIGSDDYSVFASQRINVNSEWGLNFSGWLWDEADESNSNYDNRDFEQKREDKDFNLGYTLGPYFQVRESSYEALFGLYYFHNRYETSNSDAYRNPDGGYYSDSTKTTYSGFQTTLSYDYVFHINPQVDVLSGITLEYSSALWGHSRTSSELLDTREDIKRLDTTEIKVNIAKARILF